MELQSEEEACGGRVKTLANDEFGRSEGEKTEVGVEIVGCSDI